MDVFEIEDCIILEFISDSIAQEYMRFIDRFDIVKLIDAIKREGKDSL